MLDHAPIPDRATDRCSERSVSAPDLTPFELDVALLTLSTTDANTEDLAAALDLEPDHFLRILARPHVAAFIQAAVSLERFRADLAATRAHAEALEALATVARNPDNDIQKRARAATAILRSIGAAGSTRAPRATDRCSERSVSPRSKTPPHTDTLALLTTALEHFTEASPGADVPDPEPTTLDQIYALLPADPASILDACALPLRRAGLESILATIPDLKTAAGSTLAHERDTFAENGRIVRQLTFLGTPTVPGGTAAGTGAITLEFTLHNFGYRTQRWRITAITQVDPNSNDDPHTPGPHDTRDDGADVHDGFDDSNEEQHAAPALNPIQFPALLQGATATHPDNTHDPP